MPLMFPKIRNLSPKFCFYRRHFSTINFFDNLSAAKTLVDNCALPSVHPITTPLVVAVVVVIFYSREAMTKIDVHKERDEEEQMAFNQSMNYYYYNNYYYSQY